MKPFWLSAVEMSQEPVQELMSSLKPYGLALKGHFWKNDLKNMGWTDVREGINDPDIAFWSILVSAKNLDDPAIRYGLSMSALAVRAQRGPEFPVVIIQSDEQGESRNVKKAIVSDQLPTLLQGAKCYLASDTGLSAKLVAAAHSPVKRESFPYQIGIHADPQVGQWFEIRPSENQWPGAIFGVSGAKIVFQAVGPKDRLPEKTILNYPMEGLKVTLREKEYTAWAVKNELNRRTSYFVKVDGHPASILFGPYTQEDSAEMYTMRLK